MYLVSVANGNNHARDGKRGKSFVSISMPGNFVIIKKMNKSRFVSAFHLTDYG
jgi:hypothetical protein